MNELSVVAQRESKCHSNRARSLNKTFPCSQEHSRFKVVNYKDPLQSKILFSSAERRLEHFQNIYSMEHQPVDKVLVSAKFVGADGKERRRDADHVEVRRDSCIEELVRAAFLQFCPYQHHTFATRLAKVSLIIWSI